MTDVPLDNPTIDRALACVKRSVATWHDGQAVAQAEVVSRYTTLANHVLRVRTEVGGETREVFVKINRERSAKPIGREYDRTIALQAFFDCDERFGCVHPIAMHDDPPMLVLAAVPGEPLLDTIRSSCERWTRESVARAVEHAVSAGQWVRTLEERSIGAAPPSEVAWRMLHEANVAADHIRQRGYDHVYGSTVRRCLQTIGDLADHAPDAPVYLAHGDMHAENLLVCDGPNGRVTAIDAAVSQPQFIGYDALFFCHQLDTVFGRLRYRPQHIRRVRDAFCEGYGRALDTSDRTIAAMHALNGLRSLRYTTTLSQRGHMVRRIWSHWDGRRIARSLARRAA